MNLNNSHFIQVALYFNRIYKINHVHSLSYKVRLLYSGTLVYVHFGISPTWYTSCLDAKNFVWYMTFVWNTTRVHQNESRNFVFFRINFL
jgi:hypothetical protein